MGSLFRTLGAIIFISLFVSSLCITKNFVNNSMPEMRPTFVVNFDMSTVICQHSPDPSDLHLHQMSILCDGKSDCYSNPAMHDESFPYCEGRCNSTCNHRGACLFDGVRGQCYCNAGYHGPNCEYKDFNECEDRPCHWLAHCQNTLGSYYCTCFPGFQGNGHECSDIDECQLGIAKCPSNSVCVNLPGTFFCNCTEGFQQLGLPAERCADIDECEQGLNNCPANLKCQNEIGSYKCVEECSEGFRVQNNTCVDVDECAERTAFCDKRATCTNTLGGYNCKCEEGFAGNGRTCSPINDCSQQEGICDRHAFCLGSYRTCICHTGYVGDGLSCYDVNECESKINPCDGQATDRCVNIDGGYICCSRNKSDEQCIREKGAFCSGGCGLNAICNNETCVCMEGYEGDPKVKCEDVNECENDKQCPGIGEWCVNMQGGFTCCGPDSKESVCLTRGLVSVQETRSGWSARENEEGGMSEKSSGGFIFTNANMHPTNLIEISCTGGCPKDSHCVNGTCQCNEGFIGSPIESCDDIDECSDDPCKGPDAWCVNLHGSFQCCTPDSEEADCLGLEIIGGPNGGLKLTGERKASQATLSSTTNGTKIESEAERSESQQMIWKTESSGEWKKKSGGTFIVGINHMNGTEESLYKGLINTEKKGSTEDNEVVQVETDGGEGESEVGKGDQQIGLEISGREGISSGSGTGYKVEVINGILQTTTSKPRIDVVPGETTSISRTDNEEKIQQPEVNETKTEIKGGITEQQKVSTIWESMKPEYPTTARFEVTEKIHETTIGPTTAVSRNLTSGPEVVSSETATKGDIKDEVRESTMSATTGSTKATLSVVISEAALTSTVTPNLKTINVEATIPKECEKYISKVATSATTQKPNITIPLVTNKPQSEIELSRVTSALKSPTDIVSEKTSSSSKAEGTKLESTSNLNETEKTDKSDAKGEATAPEVSQEFTSTHGATLPPEIMFETTAVERKDSTRMVEVDMLSTTEMQLTSNSPDLATTPFASTENLEFSTISPDFSTIISEVHVTFNKTTAGTMITEKSTDAKNILSTILPLEATTTTAEVLTAFTDEGSIGTTMNTVTRLGTLTISEDGSTRTVEPASGKSSMERLTTEFPETNFTMVETTTKNEEKTTVGKTTVITIEKENKTNSEKEIEMTTEKIAITTSEEKMGTTTEKETQITTKEGIEVSTLKAVETTTEKKFETTAGNKVSENTEATTSKEIKAPTEKEAEFMTERTPGTPGNEIIGTTEKHAEATTNEQNKASSEKEVEFTTEKTPETSENEIIATTEKQSEAATKKHVDASAEEARFTLETTTERNVGTTSNGEVSSTSTVTEEMSSGTTEQSSQIEVSEEVTEKQIKLENITSTEKSITREATTLELPTSGDIETNTPNVIQLGETTTLEASSSTVGFGEKMKTTESTLSTKNMSAEPSIFPSTPGTVVATAVEETTVTNAAEKLETRATTNAESTAPTVESATILSKSAKSELTTESANQSTNGETLQAVTKESGTTTSRKPSASEQLPILPKESGKVPACGGQPDERFPENIHPNTVFPSKTVDELKTTIPIPTIKNEQSTAQQYQVTATAKSDAELPRLETSTITGNEPAGAEAITSKPIDASSTNKNIERTTLQETVRPVTATIPEKWRTTTGNPTAFTTTAYNESSKAKRCYSSDECTKDAYCERRSGVCRCYPGFVGAPPQIPCVDVNECDRHLDDCDPTSRCWNIVGGYTCTCDSGYRKLPNGKCVDINECEEKKSYLCHSNAVCSNLPGSYSCQCKAGYTGDGYSCIPIDKRYCTAAEMEKYDCGRNHLCLVDRFGNGDCETCKKGYEMRFGVCSDVNECGSFVLNACHQFAFCSNIMGSYICECQEGYRGDGFWCNDVDECQQNPCHPQASCINVPGSYVCKCPAGWIGDGKESCVNPLDRKCQDKNVACGASNHTSCLSVRIEKLVSLCECDANFRYNPTLDLCEDVDECSENRHNCNPSNSMCVNTIGGFTCQCLPGYEGVGGICVDIDECARQSGDCSTLAHCENLIGSVSCKCAPGYIGDGVVCKSATSGCNEEWRNLCQAQNKTCHIDDEEIPQCGSCLLGHQPVNGKCLSLNGAGNCADPRKNDCDVNAQCIDVNPGRHYCTCKAGYIGDGRRCDGPNCHLDINMCHKNAKCRIDGKCECNGGYYGDGVTLCESIILQKQPQNSTETSLPATSSARLDLEQTTEKENIKNITVFEETQRRISVVTTTGVYPTLVFKGTTSGEILEGVNVNSVAKNDYIGSRKSVIQKCSLTDRSPCHVLANCDISSGICVCKPGYYGDGYFTCSKDWQDCMIDNTICDMRAICDFHTRRCRCIEGYIGDGVTCEPDSLDCMLRQNLCSENARCIGRRCVCAEGFTGDGTSCVPLQNITDCSRCDTNADCVSGICKCQLGYFGNGITCIPDPFDCIHYPGICHRNGVCEKRKRRCKCILGFRGDGIDCSTSESCLENKSICHESAECLSSGVCQCKQGFIGNGVFCNAAILISGNERNSSPKLAGLNCTKQCRANEVCIEGECFCAPGYHRSEANICVDVNECEIGPQCHPTAKCINLPGSYMCICADGYKGDGKNCALQEKVIGNMKVSCETDGMSLYLEDEASLVDGRIFVKGQTENPYCSKKLSPLLNSTDHSFKIPYLHCNVRYEEPNTFSVTIVIQRHPMFITHSADAYELKCTYPVGTLEASSRLNVSELATSSSIVEHGTGPTCELSVTNEDDVVIDTAIVGQILHLALSVKPNDTYGILPRNCFAINLETGERYSLTDKAGCSTDAQLFPEWTYKKPSLTTAAFRTFKWPDSSMIRFQCDCSACIGICPRVNCGRLREAMDLRRKFRYARNAEQFDELEKVLRAVVISKEAAAFSPPLLIDEDEEEKLAQREMDNWRYQNLNEIEPANKVEVPERICIRALWMGISLLPLLLMIALLGILSIFWKRRSRLTTHIGSYRSKCADNVSYLNF